MTDNKILLKAFHSFAERMVDVEHIYNIVKHKVGADIQKGDYVISTTTYDSSIFVVPELATITKGGKRKPLPNPYEQSVVKSEHLNLTRRAKGDEKDEAGIEKRIKVRKLNLLGWDAENNTYPIQSKEIIFRQREINFADEYAYAIEWARAQIAGGVNEWRTATMLESVRKSLDILNHLARIPPFPAFYDLKYGFLVKRELNMARIVLEPVAQSARDAADEALQSATNEIIRETEKRNDGISFKEAIVAEAMKPSRMSAYLDRNGEAAFEMFEAS